MANELNVTQSAAYNKNGLTDVLPGVTSLQITVSGNGVSKGVIATGATPTVIPLNGLTAPLGVCSYKNLDSVNTITIADGAAVGGAITAATNASPIVVTAPNHGLVTGQSVTITGALGNTAANGTFVVTVLTSSTFSLNGSTGNGAYTGSGVWIQSAPLGHVITTLLPGESWTGRAGPGVTAPQATALAGAPLLEYEILPP